MNIFLEKINNVNWKDVLDLSNCQAAYSLFLNTFTNLYETCFPLKKFKINHYNRKPWLSKALKTSIKFKNKLYLKSVKIATSENKNHYKQYRNKLNSLLRKVEREHYAQLLQQNKTNLKKSWTIFKNIINKKKRNYVQVNFQLMILLLLIPKI